ncbi:DUF1482 domain-containing protein, partial [Escherichia coli]|nr:DUF1482 domain-containing protein [Escherichia coli]
GNCYAVEKIIHQNFTETPASKS